MTKGFDIPPDAVRVWRGYRAPTLALPDFFQKLGTVFVPATVKMQIAAGLDGYIPSVPAGLPNKPDSVPDETAILFWDSQQTYTDGFNVLAVRTYTLTHGAVYRPPSGAEFPVVYAGALVSEQPYYLIDKPADWMHGQVSHLIGGRPARSRRTSSAPRWRPFWPTSNARASWPAPWPARATTTWSTGSSPASSPPTPSRR